MRQKGLHEPDRGLEVDPHVALDVGPAAGRERLAPAGTRVVDEQMQGAVLALEYPGDPGGRSGVGEIGSDHGRRCRQLLLERSQAILAPGDEDQMHVALLGEPARGRFADAAGGAGDDGYVSARGSLSHAASAWLLRRSASGWQIGSHRAIIRGIRGHAGNQDEGVRREAERAGERMIIPASTLAQVNASIASSTRPISIPKQLLERGAAGRGLELSLPSPDWHGIGPRRHCRV